MLLASTLAGAGSLVRLPNPWLPRAWAGSAQCRTRRRDYNWAVRSSRREVIASFP